MPSVFPGALDNIASNKLNSTVSATDHPDHHNLLADAVNAIEATLGAGLSNIVTSVGATAPITSTGGSTPTIGVTSAALTKVDDTNVTLTLGGSPTTSLLAATSLTLGWTGQLSPARGGTGVNNGTNTLTIGASASVSGANTGDVTLATNSGLGFTSGQTGLALGTPTTVTSSSTNSVTTNTHSHAITPGLGFIGNGTAQNQIPVTGATPFAPSWTSISSISGSIDHNSTTNLTTGDVHTQYAFLAGRVGNQTLIGGTAASGTLTLQSTANATRGKILFGTSAYDEVNNRLGIAAITPSFDLSFGNAAARTISIEATAAGTAGRALTVGGGNTTAGGTNISGGTVFVDSGLGTGSGASNIIFRTGDPATVATDLQGPTPTERMRINNTGDVGIGVTSPTGQARLHIDKTITPSLTGVVNGFFADIDVTGHSSGGTDARTFNLLMSVSGANNITSQWGSFVNVSNNLDTTKTVTNHYAYGGGPRIIGAGASTNMGGFYAQPVFQATATGNVTNYFGLRSGTWTYTAGATSTITNAYGLYLDGLYNATYSTNAYGVYQAGATDKNYFAGNVGIKTTSPRGPLDIVANAPSVFQRDNAAVAAIHSYYNANTTNNNGINWTFYSDTTGVGAAALQIFGQWDLRFDQHDHATRSSSVLMRNYVNGASNIWLWGGSNGNVGVRVTSAPSDNFTVNGASRVFGAAYTESTTNAGVYMGSPSADNPRVMWADGTGRNWQIDVTGNLMRWILPGWNMMRLEDAAVGTGDAVLTLWTANTAYLTVSDAVGFSFNSDVAPAGGFKITTSAVSGGGGTDFTAQAGSSTAGTSNAAGGSLYLNAGQGTGGGASDLIFRTGASTGTATALQTLTTRLTIGNNGNFTFADTANFVVGTTTGLKIGTATTQKIGFYNATPVVRPTAYTQTYSTADKTMAARTAAALTDNTGGTVSTTLAAITAGATYTQADMVAVKNALASLADQMNKSRNDSLDIAQVVNAVIDDLQALGLVG